MGCRLISGMTEKLWDGLQTLLGKSEARVASGPSDLPPGHVVKRPAPIHEVPMYFREWCLKPANRCGRMLPVERVRQFENAPDAGYASVYMFNEAAAKEITAAGSSAGLARFPVYADSLTLDLDNGEYRQAQMAIKGLAHTVYSSGGKGYHIVIPLTGTLSGTNIPYSQRKWVEGRHIKADMSLYQAGHIISLPGRKHPKTGKRKSVVETVEGVSLQLPLLEPPAPTFSLGAGDPGTELEHGLWRLLQLLQAEPAPGGRHTALWGAAKHLADAGLEYETVLNLLIEINRQWHEPKTDEEVARAVQGAFR